MMRSMDGVMMPTGKEHCGSRLQNGDDHDRITTRAIWDTSSEGINDKSDREISQDNRKTLLRPIVWELRGV